MVQKPLFKKAQKAQGKATAANRHGKILKQKKGKFALPPKKDAVREKLAVEQALTKEINLKNESKAASKAEQTGGRLGVVKAPAQPVEDRKGSKKDKRK